MSEPELNLDEFAAKLVHDLKTPLGNSIMYSELLVTELEQLKQDHPELREDVDGVVQISRNIYMVCQKLLNQIDSWGYVQHLLSGRYIPQPESLQVDEVINKVLQGNRMYMDRKKIELEVDYDAGQKEIHADPELLRLGLDNILMMMITYADTEDRISVVTEKQGDRLEILLTDSYQGDRGFLKERFEAQSFSGTEVPSEGLLKYSAYGMIFCSVALARMGAERHVEKVEKGGLRFRISLPTRSD